MNHVHEYTTNHTFMIFLFVLKLFWSYSVLSAQSYCLSTVSLPNSSGQIEMKEIQWLNKPAEPIFLHRSSDARHDPVIDDPALNHGIWVDGDVSFKIDAKGRQFAEVFLMVDDGGRHGFTLLENGIPVDTMFAESFDKVRMRPKGIRSLTLMAKVNGKGVLTVNTTAPHWILSAVRLTSENEFEEQWVPKMLDRVRRMSDPFFDGLRQHRERSMKQLWMRLLHSKQSDVQKEALLGTASVFYWNAAQNHEPIDIRVTNELFHHLDRVMPNNSIVRQMISSSYMGLNVGGPQYIMPGSEFKDRYPPVSWSVDVPDNPENAPGWATAQRVLMRRLEKLTGWWVNNRQIDNGELGGGWGDDVEIIRHWSVQALGFGSPTAARGIKRIADGVWVSDELNYGYNAEVRDVEHSSEPTTDTQPMLAALFPDDFEVLHRLATTTECMKNWLTEQPDGHWRFRSAWFSCREIDTSPERSVDVHHNVRAAGPTLWYAYLSRDQEVIDLLTKWGESWVDVMRKTQHDKPAGIIPSVVQSRDGNYLVRSSEWDKPNAEWDYFQWSGGSQERLASLILGLYTLTGETRWLKAVQESFAVMKDGKTYPRLCDEIRNKPETFFQWRRITGSTEFDEAFHVTSSLNRNQILQVMEKEALRMEQWIGVNFDMYTKEVMNTDRVYFRFQPEFCQYLFGGDSPSGERVPNFAVTWPQIDVEVARAVLEWGRDNMVIELYNFEEKPVDLPIRFWQFKPGKYQWRIQDEIGVEIGKGSFNIQKLPAIASFHIPAEQSVTLSLDQ
jgi:hypothetical protein